MQYDLSILIPARNEMFLAKTIEDLLANIEGNTEIIVVLDGAWSDPALPVHPRLSVVYLPESIGQRAATNLAARLSNAKYVMKTDAHCAFDKGFDIKMMVEMQDDWTMVPTMRNLHVFDWVCEKCGEKKYQGRTPTGCAKCDNKTAFRRDMEWVAKKSPQSVSYRVDTTLHFQYFGQWEKTHKGEIEETMSLQGSCFMLTREKYWELDICEEAFGSWGQQGCEVAFKTWLSGGRVVVNKKTWYAHLFRTQGGDFGFPYPLSGKQTDHARNYCRDLFFNNKYPKQIYPLSWLIEKFAPLPEWHEDKGKEVLAMVKEKGEEFYKSHADLAVKKLNEETLTKGILYYTDNKLDPGIMAMCQKQLEKADLPIVSVSLKPLDFGENIVLPLERGYLTMAKQILAGLHKLNADIVYFCEHDVLYHPSHFDFTPTREDVYYYNENQWKVRESDGHALYYRCKQLSGLCARRDLLIKHFTERVRRIEVEGFSRKMGFEPGTHNRPERVDDYKAEAWRSLIPNIDIRHGGNLTSSRWKKEEFRNQRNCQDWQESDTIPGWGKWKEIIANI